MNENIPSNAKQPADHKTPVQVEADGDPTITVQWNEVDWTVPATVDDWSLEAVQAYEDDRGSRFLQHILGPKQWTKFVEGKPKVREINGLSKAIQDKAGYGNQGE